MSHSHDQKKKSASSKMPAFAWALVRCWMGVFFLLVGLADVPAQLGASVFSGVTQSAGIASLAAFHAHPLGGFMPFLQVAIGALLLFGVLTPFAALAGLGVTLWSILPGGLDLAATGTTVAVILLALVLAKAGRYAGVDAILHRRVQLPLL